MSILSDTVLETLKKASECPYADMLATDKNAERERLGSIAEAAFQINIHAKAWLAALCAEVVEAEQVKRAACAAQTWAEGELDKARAEAADCRVALLRVIEDTAAWDIYRDLDDVRHFVADLKSRVVAQAANEASRNMARALSADAAPDKKGE